jgi:hypothetical protein
VTCSGDFEELFSSWVGVEEFASHSDGHEGVVRAVDYCEGRLELPNFGDRVVAASQNPTDRDWKRSPRHFADVREG